VSRAVQVDGHLGPVFGALGEHAANRASASYVADRYGARQALRPYVPSSRACYQPGTWSEIHQQVPRSGSLTPWPVNMKTCGADGLPCMDQNPVAPTQMGLAGGFGDVSNWACTSWAAIMTQLEGLLVQAESAGLNSTPEYVGARSYFNSTTGAFDKPILHCAEHTQSATQFYNALNARLGGGAPPPLPDSGGVFPSAVNVSSIVKWSAIGLAAIAGAYALGPIFRGIGGLIPARKK
jgi:hypothetical protein